MGGTSSRDISAKENTNSITPSSEHITPLASNTTSPHEKLPAQLQKIVDEDDTLFERIYDGNTNDSTNSNVRYAAYAARARTILLSAHRYVAYTSDIGESFRPVAHPWLVRGAYGISWIYLLADVTNESYKAYLRQQRIAHPGTPGVISYNATDATASGAGAHMTGQLKPEKVPAIEDYRTVMMQRAIFQSVASMGLPAFTIHSIVRYSGQALKKSKNLRIRSYGPIGLGLAAVPFLPYMFDEPVETVVEWSFHKAFETFGGPDAVGRSPEIGREAQLQRENKRGVIKKKEL